VCIVLGSIPSGRFLERRRLPERRSRLLQVHGAGWRPVSVSRLGLIGARIIEMCRVWVAVGTAAFVT